jgi:hypothetical protein
MQHSRLSLLALKRGERYLSFVLGRIAFERYGDVIQLQHKSSGAFVSVCETAAPNDPECRKVELDFTGSRCDELRRFHLKLDLMKSSIKPSETTLLTTCRKRRNFYDNFFILVRWRLTIFAKLLSVFFSAYNIDRNIYVFFFLIIMSSPLSAALFRLMPRFKVQMEGSTVYYANAFIIESVKLRGMALHTSEVRTRHGAR